MTTRQLDLALIFLIGFAVGFSIACLIITISPHYVVVP